MYRFLWLLRYNPGKFRKSINTFKLYATRSDSSKLLHD